MKNLNEEIERINRLSDYQVGVVVNEQNKDVNKSKTPMWDKLLSVMLTINPKPEYEDLSPDVKTLMWGDDNVGCELIVSMGDEEIDNMYSKTPTNFMVSCKRDNIKSIPQMIKFFTDKGYKGVLASSYNNSYRFDIPLIPMYGKDENYKLNIEKVKNDISSFLREFPLDNQSTINQTRIAETNYMRKLMGLPLINEQVDSTTTTKVNVDKTEQGTTTTTTTTNSVVIPYTQNVSYDTGKNTISSDSYKSLTDGIFKAINANAEAKKMLDTKNIQLTKISVMGGSSNSWGKVKTGYDYENDRTTKSKTTPNDSGYQKNKKLATDRSNFLLPQIVEYIKNNGIVINDNIEKTVSSVVINTNGFTDSDPKRPSNLQLGQFVTIKLSFNYLKIESEKMFEPLDNPKYITTGSYFCNGKNGLGQSQSPKVTESCGGMKTKPVISIFDLKWLPKTLDDMISKKIVDSSYKLPAIRYTFYWNNGKIETIKLSNFGGKHPKFVPSDNIKTDTNAMNDLKKYFNMGKYAAETGKKVEGTNSFDSLVGKYL
jgi:hypothetical protein